MKYRDLYRQRAFAARQYEKEREYWVNKLSGQLVKTSFPSDVRARGVTVTGKKLDTVIFQFPSELFERLMEIINNSDSRLFMALVTGLSLLLYKYTGNKDIILGAPIDKQEIEGEFINTILALRNQIEEQMTVKEFLKQVRQTIIQASEHQNYPLETIPYELNIPVVEGDFPLFDTAILLRNIQKKRYIQHMNLNMVFSFLRTGEYLECIVEYNASLFVKETIDRIIKHFIYLVQGAFNNVDLKLVNVPILTGEEREQMVFDFNETAADYPREKMIHQLFEEQVEKTPGNIAVESKDEILTYKELNEKSNQLARLLREKGIKPGMRPINTTAAIMLESSVEVLIAVMAVLKAGGAYLPMGFEYPGKRINYLLENSKAQLLLTRKSLVENMEIQCPLIYLDEEELYTGGCENLESINNSDSLAYVIYTSGTTGQPKGVMVQHRALVNYIWWAAKTYVKDEPVDFPLYTSISFDLTVTSIFTPLITGNAVIVYGGKDKEFYIEKVIDDNRVGVVKLTPSHLKLIKQKKVIDSRIKRLIVGGEELETQLARDIYTNFDKNIEIYNEYGPTETVVGSMIYKFDPGADTRLSVPIGIPIANTRIYLLNEYHQPVPLGGEAELYISGDGLARGYLYNPGLTQEKFLPNPFIPGQKIYRTGDLAIRLPNGNIEFRGRKDQQVKIRGYRVETGEIETRIVNFQEISNAKREQKESIVEKLDLKSVVRCKTCLIPVNYPGGIYFDEDGRCDICREFETYKDKAFAYFKTSDDFHQVVEKTQKTKKSDYDCLMLYSGGKDSSYVLHRLKEMGLNILSFTFNNGYISETAFENIKRTTSLLNVDHIVLDSEAMKEIFVESLWSDYNVCNGCFKAVNTLGTKLAHEHNINLVVSGLTRGQIFDIKLHGLFKLGIFDEESINEKLKLFRQNYHAMTQRTSRLIGVEITHDMLKNIYFTDYYRYDDVSVSEIFEYLKQKDNGWVRPTDTGASSSNCIINDVGIYVHLKDKGSHFYAAQLSWDCRLGTITREEGIEEITGFKVDYPGTHRVLKEIGYYDAFTGAVVVDAADQAGDKALCAYILADKEFDISELRAYLSRELPDYMIPTYFTKIDKIPLTPGGKIDRKALPEPELNIEGEYAAPGDIIEEKLAEVWSELLGLKKENISIDVNFFEIGGHSLRATFLAAAVQKEFNVRMPLVKIFETPTIRGLAGYITESAKETFDTIHPVEKKEYYVLSSAQERLYIQHRLDPDSTAYNMPAAFLLKGRLDRKKFEETFYKIIESHEALRTCFCLVEGDGVQKVYDKVDFKVGYCKCIEAEAKERVKDLVKPFDLSRAPLLRVELIHTREEKYFIFFDMHHIISDGSSIEIIVKDFVRLYEGNNLTPLPVQYKDYAAWQAKLLNEEKLKKQGEYWLKQLDGYVFTQLPIDRFDSYHRVEGKEKRLQIEASVYDKIEAFCNKHKVTKFTFMITVFGIVLAREIDQPDITIGIPISIREHTDLKYVIGIFLNVLLLRTVIHDEDRFSNHLAKSKKTLLEAFNNQDYPYEILNYKIRENSQLKKNELFSILFNYFPVEIDKEISTNDFEIGPLETREVSPKYDMTLYVHEADDDMTLTLVYKGNIYYENSIKNLLDDLLDVIHLVLENEDITISTLTCPGEDDYDEMDIEFEEYYEGD